MKNSNKFFSNFFIDSIKELKSNYWFVPALMTISSIVASVLLVLLDQSLETNWLRTIEYLHLNEAEGARSLLSTIAGSMITVAGVTFSMTLLSVSHASSQIGPRILSDIMSDRGNQVTLGTFIATFVYCTLVLRVIHQDFVPHLSIFFALLLALLSVSVLIYFIHHVPQTISMTSAISRVGDQLMHKIEVLFPQEIGQGPTESKHQELPSNFSKRKIEVNIEERGFFRLTDADALVKLATEKNIIIQFTCSPGDYLIPGVPIAYFYHCDNEKKADLSDKIREHFFWGSVRSTGQDFYFPVDLLLEVAARALSPGVNDPVSANECMNQFCSGLVKLASKKIPSGNRLDQNEELRLIIPPINKVSFLEHFCDKYRVYCKSDFNTSTHFIKSLQKVSKVIEDRELQKAIDDQLSYLYTDAKNYSDSVRDKELLERLYNESK